MTWAKGHRGRRRKRRERSCESKVRHDTELGAVRAAAKLGKSYYRCRFCSGYHLTTRGMEGGER